MTIDARRCFTVVSCQRPGEAGAAGKASADGNDLAEAADEPALPGAPRHPSSSREVDGSRHDSHGPTITEATHVDVAAGLIQIVCHIELDRTGRCEPAVCRKGGKYRHGAA